MKISIEYKVRASGTTQAIELTKDQYFEGDVAKFGDNIEYVLQQEAGLQKKDIEYTLLTISGSNEDLIQRETYFADENELRYIRHSTGGELIVQQIQISKNCFVITRMERENIGANWKNVSFSTIVNPSTKEEQLLNARKGEYLNHTH